MRRRPSSPWKIARPARRPATTSRPRPRWALLAAAVAGAALFAGPAAATARADDRPAASGPSVLVVDFEGEIAASLSAYVRRHLAAAKADRRDVVVLRIESPGGTVHHSEEIADAVLAMPATTRVVAWIPKRALSGASMVALACDEIAMAPRATIGDCQPILLDAGGIKPVGEKAETVLRALFRRYAAENGWPSLVTEKLVSVDMQVVRVRDTQTGQEFLADGGEFDSARDDDLVEGVRKGRLTRVSVVVDRGRLLTMTTEETRAFGFATRTFATEDEMLAAIAGPTARVDRVSMSFSESAGRWLLEYAGVLAAIALLGVTITVFQGFGTISLIGIGALSLLALVTATADLANGFPLLLIAVGVLLLALEAFVIPGFGVAGILGIASLFGGLLFLSTGFTLERPEALTWPDAERFLVQLVVTALVAIGVFVLLSRLFPGLPFVRRRLLLPAEGLGAGPVVTAGSFTPSEGARGVAVTDLRPAGRMTLLDRTVDVVTEGDFVALGAAVVVVRVEGSRVVVRSAGTGAP